MDRQSVDQAVQLVKRYFRGLYTYDEALGLVMGMGVYPDQAERLLSGSIMEQSEGQGMGDLPLRLVLAAVQCHFENYRVRGGRLSAMEWMYHKVPGLFNQWVASRTAQLDSYGSLPYRARRM